MWSDALPGLVLVHDDLAWLLIKHIRSTELVTLGPEGWGQRAEISVRRDMSGSIVVNPAIVLDPATQIIPPVLMVYPLQQLRLARGRNKSKYE
ncbi:hypothetical protein NBRC116588_18570 [Pyruvatibacter sp. HU-CL02332]